MVASLEVLKQTGLEGGSGFSPSGCNPEGRCGNGLEKIYPTCAVRYGYMRYIGEFKYAPGMLFGCGGRVVIQSNRGIEIGEQVSLTCSGCDKSINRKQILDYVKSSGQEYFRLKAGRILRTATAADLEEERRLNNDASAKLAQARDLGERHGLSMKFVACEHLFGGERIIFHFMSESRVDFRELVKDLAHEYHTRIEMHQVGARDEARLVADYEICGRECCCKNFLKTLRPVSMRMAKLQKSTLDPSKVSGRCGRLRCCLRYEHEGYEELNKKLPRIGARVRTNQGAGTVADRQVLTQLVTICYDGNGRFETVGIEDVLERDLPKRDPSEAPGPPSRGSGPDRSQRRDRNTSRAEPSGRRAAPAEQAETKSAGPPAGKGTDRSEATTGGDERPRRRRRRRGRRRREGDGGSSRGSGEGAGSPPGDQPGI